MAGDELMTEYPSKAPRTPGHPEIPEPTLTVQDRIALGAPLAR